MLTKEQYKFLKELIKEAKKEKKLNEILSKYNREKISIDTMSKLLSKHPKINLAQPFKNDYDDDDYVDDIFLTQCIFDYLKNVNLDNCIDCYDSEMYGISSKGLELMSEFRIEIWSKLRLPLIALFLSLSAIVISIISFFN